MRTFWKVCLLSMSWLSWIADFEEASLPHTNFSEKRVSQGDFNRLSEQFDTMLKEIRQPSFLLESTSHAPSIFLERSPLQETIQIASKTLEEVNSAVGTTPLSEKASTLSIATSAKTRELSHQKRKVATKAKTLASRVQLQPTHSLHAEEKEVVDRILNAVQDSLDTVIVTQEVIMKPLLLYACQEAQAQNISYDDPLVEILFRQVLHQLQALYPKIVFEGCSSFEKALEQWGYLLAEPAVVMIEAENSLSSENNESLKVQTRAVQLSSPVPEKVTPEASVLLQTSSISNNFRPDQRVLSNSSEVPLSNREDNRSNLFVPILEFKTLPQTTQNTNVLSHSFVTDQNVPNKQPRNQRRSSDDNEPLLLTERKGKDPRRAVVSERLEVQKNENIPSTTAKQTSEKQGKKKQEDTSEIKVSVESFTLSPSQKRKKQSEDDENVREPVGHVERLADYPSADDENSSQDTTGFPQTKDETPSVDAGEQSEDDENDPEEENSADQQGAPHPSGKGTKGNSNKKISPKQRNQFSFPKKRKPLSHDTVSTIFIDAETDLSQIDNEEKTEDMNRHSNEPGISMEIFFNLSEKKRAESSQLPDSVSDQNLAGHDETHKLTGQGLCSSPTEKLVPSPGIFETSQETLKENDATLNENNKRLEEDEAQLEKNPTPKPGNEVAYTVALFREQ